MGLITLTSDGCCEDKWNNKQIIYKFLYRCHRRTGRTYNLQQTAAGRFLLERGLKVAMRGDKNWHVLFQTLQCCFYVFYIENTLRHNTRTASWYTRMLIFTWDLSSNLIFLWGFQFKVEDWVHACRVFVWFHTIMINFSYGHSFFTHIFRHDTNHILTWNLSKSLTFH